MRTHTWRLAMVMLLTAAATGCDRDPDPSPPPGDRPGPALVKGAQPPERPVETSPEASDSPIVARVADVTGDVTFTRKFQILPISAGKALHSSDSFDLGRGDAHLTLDFAGQQRVSVAPDSVISLEGSPGQGIARMRLWSGALDKIDVADARIEIGTAYGVRLTVESGSGEAQVTPGEEIRFQRSADGVARVDVAGETTTLGSAAWTLRVADRAHVVDLRGDVTVARGGKQVPLDRRETLGTGNTIRLADADASLKLRFTDRGRLALVGPAELSLVQIDMAGRRVMLRSGTIERVETRGIALEIQTPREVSLTLQNAGASASVRDDGSVEFSEVKGQYARVWRGGALHELEDGRWSSSE